MEPTNIRERNTDKIPVICIDKDTIKKFLIPDHITLSQFIYFYRQKLKLKPDCVIYVQIEGRKLINFNDIIGDLFDLYHSDDFCLYLHISNEAYMG